MEKFMNIKKNNLFKKDFNYPLFSRVRIKSDMTFFFVLEQRTFLFHKKVDQKNVYFYYAIINKFIKNH